MRPALLLTALLVALPVQAQAPLVTNAPFAGVDFLRSGGAEPDTTEAWRYFPLAVGNAWEYYNYFTGERLRVDVYGTETHNGRTYFSTIDILYDGDGAARAAPPGHALRYDTTAAAVWFYVHETGGERSYFEASCPLDAPFGGQVNCYLGGEAFAVGGGYDGLLAFGEPLPGTGEDTVRTAVKTYGYTDPGIFFDLRYAAGLGLVYYDDEYVRRGLYYARVDGVEYGVSVLPPFTVDAEIGSPEPADKLALEVYPNPVRARLTLAFDTEAAAPVVVEVVDVLGRVVLRRTEAGIGVGAHTLPLDVSALVGGVYFARVQTGSGAAMRPFVVAR